MTEREKNASDKAQKLISRFISECEVDEDYLLREKMNLRWMNIALFFKANDKNITHATVIHSHHYYKVYKDENPKLEELEKQFNFTPVDLDTLDKIHMLENKVKNLKKVIQRYEKVN